MTEEEYEKKYDEFKRQEKLNEDACIKFENLLKEKGVIYHKNKGLLRSLTVGEFFNHVESYFVYLQSESSIEAQWQSQPKQVCIFFSCQESLSKNHICPAGYMKAYVGDVIRKTIPDIDCRSLYVSYCLSEDKYLVKPLSFLRSYNKAYIKKSREINKNLGIDYFKNGLQWMRLEPREKKVETKELYQPDPEDSFIYLLNSSIELRIDKRLLVEDGSFFKLFDLTHYDNFWKLKMKVKIREMETLFGKENFYV